MKERGDNLSERFSEFPWMLSDLMSPFMMEYLVSTSLVLPRHVTNLRPARVVSNLGDHSEHPR